MRLGTALFTLMFTSVLVVPTGSAALTDTATFSTTLPCVAGGTYVLGAGITVPGCSFTHSGSLHVTSCDLSRCLLTLTLHDAGAGLPPGVQTLATTVDDDSNGAGISTACSTLAVSLGPTLACDATKQLALDFSSGCRFLVVDTIGAIDVKIAGAELTDAFRVCSTGTTFTIEEV